MKNFDTWNGQKQFLQSKESIPFFYEKEIWFIAMGKNIGFEQDGKGEQFARPVLVVRKCNKYCFLGIPLTTNEKDGIYYESFDFQGKISTAILSQVRLFSSNRLLSNKGKIETKSFMKVKKKLRALFV